MTLQKWSNKVLAIAPQALLPANRTKFSRSTNNQAKSAVQLVDETLLEREKLLSRTRVRRGKGVRLVVESGVERGGGPDADLPVKAAGGGAVGEAAGAADADGDADVFDDTDFYQQLLRDVIEAREGGGAGLDGAGDEWRAAQKQRKARKAVDTRASKGRKLRFVRAFASTLYSTLMLLHRSMCLLFAARGRLQIRGAREAAELHDADIGASGRCHHVA